MRDLYRIQDLVQDILTKDEKARNSDTYLYHEVCKRVNGEVLTVPFGAVLNDFNSYKVPNIESVGRARRKLQAQFPDLRPKKAVEEKRLENQIAYEKFARNEVR